MKIENSGDWNCCYHYFLDGNRVIEERAEMDVREGRASNCVARGRHGKGVSVRGSLGKAGHPCPLCNREHRWRFRPGT